MRIQNSVGQVDFLGSFAEKIPTTGLPEIAFVGRSNVGKSSAINCLLNRKKAARVSSTPGRTQRINLFQLGKELVFADLPGYGFAKVPDEVKVAWGTMIEAYLTNRRELKLVVVLIDSRHNPMQADKEMIAALRNVGIPFLVVGTKVDKLKRSKHSQTFRALRQGHDLKSQQFIPFSALSRFGRDAIWEAIERAVNEKELSDES